MFIVKKASCNMLLIDLSIKVCKKQNFTHKEVDLRAPFHRWVVPLFRQHKAVLLHVMVLKKHSDSSLHLLCETKLSVNIKTKTLKLVNFETGQILTNLQPLSSKLKLHNTLSVKKTKCIN